MPPIDGTPLDGLPGLPEKVLETLKASWVTTAEQLVAATAAVGGPEPMASNLGVTLPEFRRVLAAAEAALSPSERTRLKKPADTRNYGLGGPPSPGGDPSD